MSPIAVAAVAAGVHLAATLAVLVAGTGPLFARMERGEQPNRHDRAVRGVLLLLMFPIHPLTERRPGWVGRGFPREHLLLMANSASWGVVAGLIGVLARS